MELNLAGKSVVITGGGANIGRAITLAFARERSHVTIAEIDEGQGKKVAGEAQKAGAASAAVVRTDVTKWDSVQAMVKAVEARRGRVTSSSTTWAGRMTGSSSKRRARSGRKRSS